MSTDLPVQQLSEIEEDDYFFEFRAASRHHMLSMGIRRHVNQVTLQV